MDERPETAPITRWNSYGTYRLLILVSMLNEMSVVFSTTYISHSAFYIHGVIFILTIIFVGIPLAYSEICIAQYTNCTVISMWDFFPLFRGFGYGTILILISKTVFLTTLASWYLEYTFHAALDPPPWFSCDYYDTDKCMVKRINVSVFQHCLEAFYVYYEDCGMLTASYWFFDTEIGSQNTRDKPNTCFYSWKPTCAALCINVLIFFLSIKKERLLQYAVKFVVFYTVFVIIVLFCVALSTSGSWTISKTIFNWSSYNFPQCITTINRGFLSLGTGTGVLIFLTSDVPFRSPATMTAIVPSLLASSICILLSLIIFSGINTMSYYHGSEDNVIEIGNSNIFLDFASISEILSYFDAQPIWEFMWFSTIFLCLFINLWIQQHFLMELIFQNIKIARNHKNISHILVNLFTFLLSCPFHCADLFSSLTDAIELMQLMTSFTLAISLYWFYGFKKHSVDIIFMIGVKASYYWKIFWILNPILILTCIYGKWSKLETLQYSYSYEFKSLSVDLDVLTLFILLSIYCVTVTVGSVVEFVKYYKSKNIRGALFAYETWGPKDTILFKSRLMFVPEIMTTEFLYRQVRIRGYKINKNDNIRKKIDLEGMCKELPSVKIEWSALTSN